MSDLIAIATLSLCALLRDGLDLGPDTPEVLAASPWQGPEFGVCVHLHAVAPDVSARNAPSAEPGQGAAPTALRLRYLLSFFGSSDTRIHRLAGHAMAALAARPVILPDALAAAAATAGLPAPAGAHMRLAIDSLSIEEMTRLWQRFAPMRYTLSLGVACDISG